MKFKFGNNLTGQEIYYGNYLLPEQIENKVAIDVGSNVGLFVMENYNKFDNLYAIEASYENFLTTLRKVLHKNLKFNEAENVSCFNLAAAKNTGEVIKIYAHDSNGNSVSPMTIPDMFSKQYGAWKEENERYHNVLTISLEGMYEFFNVDYIDYLKVDIEGAEFDFLLGKDLSRIGCLALELHGTLGQEKKDEMKQHLEKYFNVYHIEYDLPAPQHSVITYVNKEL